MAAIPIPQDFLEKGHLLMSDFLKLLNGHHVR
jgi:hypothetical protein